MIEMSHSALRPPLFRSISYNDGNFSKIIPWGTADLTPMFLMTDVVGFDLAVAGFAILASPLVNTLLDPIVGSIADRIRGPLGRNGPLILTGVPLCSRPIHRQCETTT